MSITFRNGKDDIAKR